MTAAVHVAHPAYKHDDVIKWKHLPRCWPFVRGIHRYPVNSSHKGQCRGALIFHWSAPWINGWVNNREAGDLRSHRAHYDVTVMLSNFLVALIGGAWYGIQHNDKSKTCHIFHIPPLWGNYWASIVRIWEKITLVRCKFPSIKCCI